MIDMLQMILRMTSLDRQHEQPGGEAGVDFLLLASDFLAISAVRRLAPPFECSQPK
jgi:hypothetical protein